MNRNNLDSLGASQSLIPDTVQAERDANVQAQLTEQEMAGLRSILENTKSSSPEPESITRLDWEEVRDETQETQPACENEMLEEADVAYDRGEEIQEAPAHNENHIRNFSVEQLNYGYLVKVGCHKFAISTHIELSRLLTQYLANPRKTEEKWFANELEAKRDHTV